MKRFFALWAIAFAAMCVTYAKAQSNDINRLRIVGQYVNEEVQPFTGYSYFADRSFMVNRSDDAPVHNLALIHYVHRRATSPDANDEHVLMWAYDRVTDQPAAMRIYANGLMRITVGTDEYLYLYHYDDSANYSYPQ